MNPFYCEKCRHLLSDGHCPWCLRGRVREVRPEDPCFLAEKSAPWSGMLADVLTRNAIPFLPEQRTGAALAVRAGAMLEGTRFYVRCDDFERADALVDELFGEDSPR